MNNKDLKNGGVSVAIGFGLFLMIMSGCSDSLRKDKPLYFKRYCMTADLEKSPQAKEKMKASFQSQAWQEVVEYLQSLGVYDLEVYIYRQRLLAVLETSLEFDFTSTQNALETNVSYQAWEAETNINYAPLTPSTKDMPWFLLERVYEIDQDQIANNKLDGYEKRVLSQPTRRIIESRELVQDPKEIQRYKDLHAMGVAWPEITHGLKEIGIVDLEIYCVENRTFEFYQVSDEFDWDSSWDVIDIRPIFQKWGKIVGPIDVPYTDKQGNPVIQIMEKIYDLSQ